MRINKRPPAGATWDGPIEDVMARLSGNREPVDLGIANSNALGAISALIRSSTLAGFPADDKLKCVKKILDALDRLDQAAPGSHPTIALPRAAFAKLREGRATVAVPDSEGRRVFLFAKRVWPSDRAPGPQPAVVLSDADLDLVETPEGLVCTSTDGVASWLLRLAYVLHGNQAPTVTRPSSSGGAS